MAVLKIIILRARLQALRKAEGAKVAGQICGVKSMRCALGCRGDKCLGEMADGTYPKDVEEDNECRRASATAGCHVTPIHSLKTESYG